MRPTIVPTFRVLSGSSFPVAVHCVCMLLGLTSTVTAQTSLPGLVVTMPPAAAPQPGVAAPGPAPEVAPVKPANLKPKAATKPAAKVAAAQTSDASGKGRGSGQSILVLVNDDPITGLDVEQRTKLNALSADIGPRAQANMKALVQSEGTQTRFREAMQEIIKQNQNTKTKEQILALIEERKKQFAASLQKQALESARASVLPGLKKGVLDELIEERLKLQEAKRLNVTVEDSQVDDVIKGIAERNKMTPAQFATHLQGMGADVTAMKARFRASLSWNDVVRRRFAGQVNVSRTEIEKFASTKTAGDDDVELQLQRITLPVPGKLDQRVMAQRFQEADKLRQSFGGCKTAAAVAAKANGRFEDLGTRKPSSIAEPTRSMLLNARDGEMVPPSMADGGVELYAVCSRKVIKADEKVRTEVAADLQQKEFEILAKRHLRDLRQDAQIEYR